MSKTQSGSALFIIEISDNSTSEYLLLKKPKVTEYSFPSSQIRPVNNLHATALSALKKQFNLSEQQINIELVKGPSSDNAFRIPVYLSTKGTVENHKLYIFTITLDTEKDQQLIAHLEDNPNTKKFSTQELISEAWKSTDSAYLRFVLKNDIIEFPSQEKLSLPFVTNVPALEYHLQQKFNRIFENILGLGSGESIDIHLKNIDTEDLSFIINTNQTLKTKLSILWTGSQEPFTTEIPFPYHGVFIIHSNTGTSSNKWVWHPRFIGKQGVWTIKKYHSEGKKTSLWLRQVFDQYQYWQLPLSEPITKQHENRLTISGIHWYKGSSDNWILIDKQHEESFKNDFILKANTYSNSTDIFDEQDISYQRLLTFSSYLLDNFPKVFTKKLLKLNQTLSDQIDGPNVLNNDEQEKIWKHLVTIQNRIHYSLFPFKYLQKRGLIQSFEPLNSADAISQLMSFQRYDKPAYTLNYLPPIHRQNHPSFKGFICPVETPESFDVGLTLHLAHGVKANVWGEIFKDPNNPSGLGYSASLVPFYQYNDAARSMMGAKNIKQAVPLENGTTPWITTGTEGKLYSAIQPLIDRQVVPEYFKLFTYGVNLLVAYMPWFGWNFEDAIVANQNLADKDTLSWKYEQEYFVYIKPGYKPYKPTGDKQPSQIGDSVTPGTIVAYFKKEKTVASVQCGGNDSGTLSDLSYTKPKYAYMGGILRWKILIHKPLHVGDKLMGRYGNKGVVSVLLPDEKMPRLPDDPSLPENLRGRAVDLVLNPHGVISRMNMGQLLETHLGLLKGIGKPIPDNVGQAFTPPDINVLGDNLVVDGIIDQFGKMQLDLPDNSQTELPVTVGYQYFFRLNHLPEHKINVRGGKTERNRYNLVTGQPVAGKKHKGGQRLGEMEMWALAAHQADHIIKEVLEIKSDPYSWDISNDGVNQTYLAIKDHFFAIGINLHTEDGSGLTLVTDEDILSTCQPIDNNNTKKIATRGKMICPNEGCNYIFLKGKDIIATGYSQRSAHFYLTIEDLLKHFGYELNENIQEKIPDPQNQSSLEKTIPISFKRKKPETIIFNFSRKGRSLHVEFQIKGEKYHAYSQVDGEFYAGNFQSLRLTGDKHGTTPLICQNSTPFPIPIKGGLFDPYIFGQEGVNNYQKYRWGCIKLPFPVNNPLFGPKNIHKLNYLPILPSKYRLTSASYYLRKSGVENSITKKYIDIIDLINRYENSDQGDNKYERAIEYRINELFTEIKDRLYGTKGKSKYGLIRRHGTGRRVDYSGRLVITPDPNLGWDECGVPAEVLFTLFKDNISDYNNEDSDYQIVSEYLSKKPDTRILLNRAPTLHKYNILSFRPVPLEDDQWSVLKINPLVCKSFGADFDGDQMSIHALLNDDTNQEALLLSPTHKYNLFSAANGQPLLDFDQDFVLGHYLLSGDNKNDGLFRIEKILQDTQNCPDKITDMMRKSFEAVTHKGISFSFLELLKCAADKDEVDRIFRKTDILKINRYLEANANEKLIDCSTDPMKPGYCFAIMALSGARGKKQTRQIIAARGFLSPGATGFEKEEQDFLFKESLLEGMSLESSFWAAMNARSSMVDKNLSTAEAGSLSRKLVLALWPWHVIHADCGRHSITKCEYGSNKQICASCYGVVQGYEHLPDDYPAGLIAAQSIGERGTQLSMQSFHTGEKAFSLTDVLNLFNNKTGEDLFDESCEKFVEQFKSIGAYRDLDVRHMQVLWLAIKNSLKKSLLSAWESNMTPLSLNTGPYSFRNITKTLFDEAELNNYSPIDRLLMGLSPTRFTKD